MEYDEKIDILTSATICGSFEKTLLIVGPILEINYESLFENLEKYPDSIAKSFLINQLNRYEKIFSLQKIQE